MRLTEDQIKEAILHDDRDVREAAVYYFAQSYSDDLSIMPLAIQAIEQHGWDDAFEVYSFLSDLAQTDETILWLVEQIKRHGRPDEDFGYRHATRAALMRADTDLLKRHDATILQLKELDDEAQLAIRQRILFSSQPPEELWDHLTFFCNRSDKLENVPDDLDVAFYLAEALGKHRDFTAPKTLAILAGDTGDFDNWMELCAVRLAGEIRLQEAAPEIITLFDELDDWLFDEGHRALVKIGGDGVVEELARAYPTGSFDLRFSAASIFENMHSDLSVQTCMTFLETEQDHHIRCSLLQSVLMNFCTEGIEPARQLILTTPLDPEVLEVRSDLLTCCKLVGEKFPEFEAWREDAKGDVEFRRRWYQEHPIILDDEENAEDEEFAGEFEEPLPPPATVVRLGNRIGRNDPCPCGSGKKYKHCCLRNRPPEPDTDVANAATIAGSAQKKVQYPIGTVAFYGPDDRVTTKIVAAIIRRADAEPILERWVGTNLRQNPKVQRQIHEFFEKHGAKSVALADRNLGCPHEEGEDFPLGGDCPFCPFWAGKQGSNRRD